MVGEKKIPGGGSIVTALQTATGLQSLNTGKPDPFIINHICETYKLKREECIMIGDNLQTDILLGINSKIDTILVFSGVTSEQGSE